MKKYTVKDVVCDYGVYEDDKLKPVVLILNSKINAEKIAEILNLDAQCRIYKEQK